MDLWPSRAEVVCAISRQGCHGFSSLSRALPAPLGQMKEIPQGVIGCETAASLSRSPGPALALGEAKFPTLPWVSLLSMARAVQAGWARGMWVCDRSWCGTGELLDKSSCAVQCLKPVSMPSLPCHCTMWPVKQQTMWHKYFIFHIKSFKFTPI